MRRYKRTGRQPKEQQHQRRRMSAKMWVGVGIAIIMATSIVGFLTIGQTGPTYGEFDYNNHTIFGSPQGWQADIDGRIVTFEYLPSDVDDIPYPSDIPGWLRSTLAVSMTSSPADNLSDAIGAVEYALFTQLGEEGKIILYAFTADNAFGKPILTCDNATRYQPVILFEQGEEEHIERRGDCIVATAASDIDMRRIGERILYTHYGIIPDAYGTGTTAAAADEAGSER